MPVEIGAVDAGEPGLAAHRQAAAAAHARAVDHDRVHAHDRLDIVLLGEEGNEFHHDDGADGDDLVVAVARLDERFERIGHQSLFAVAAVVRHHLKHVGNGFELLLQNDEVFIAESDDAVYFGAELMQLLCDGERDGAADAAADDGDLFQTVHMRRLAQGADEIVNILALVEVVEPLRRSADDLEDDGNGALFPVEIGDREGDALPFLVHAQDDELPRLCLSGDEGRIHFHQRDGGVEFLLFNNFIHNLTVLSALKSFCFYRYIV